jgi:hypothetical protein
MAILLGWMRNDGGQKRLPVDALDDGELDIAMRTWEPAGCPAERT